MIIGIRKLVGTIIPILICAIVVWIAVVNITIVNGITAPPSPGTMGNIDWVDEIGLSSGVLDFWMPLLFLLVIIHAVVEASQWRSAWIGIAVELAAGISAALFSVTIWILMDRLIGEEVDLWADYIWWR